MYLLYNGMETSYCLFIHRRSENGKDFTDLPFGDLEKLTKVAEAALRIPYVTSTRLHKKVGEMHGDHPRWESPPNYQRENPTVEGIYTTEEQFKQDLRLQLQDNQLFDDLYKNKEEWREFLTP
jgi:hypothetical protein|tara:strand:- start:311 stop:679 length:369 start_codon:yes stop_codon:yes gene_type:complete